MRRFLPALAAALCLAAPATAAAAVRAGVPAPPLQLPGLAGISSVAADPGTWLVGAKPSAAAHRLTRRAGATRLMAGTYEVPVARARGLANQLAAQDLLTFAEPNRYARLDDEADLLDPWGADPVARLSQRAVPTDPKDSGWRDFAIDPTLVPPPVTAESPLLALVDSPADVQHPEFQGGNVATLGGVGLQDAHGTQTIGTAVAPANGIGVLGAYPGARALNVPLPRELIPCSDSVRGIRRAIKAGAAVINTSYGSTRFCEAEFQAVELAVRNQVIFVASGGNEGSAGNPYEFPASLPHVLTVGALAPGDTIPSFSNTNAAIDLVAPGVSIRAPTPKRFDRGDGKRDGYQIVAGTSFSAPIVAAAALWIRAARPDLTFDQAAQVVRLSATDLKRKGYDPLTGYGKLNLAAALEAAPPISDPLEPNEDLPFVNGRAFGDPTAALWSGGEPATTSALLDYFEDPGDVYRLLVPEGRTVTVTTNPDFGDPDVELFSADARHVDEKRFVLDRSRHAGVKPDRVSWRNRRGKTKTIFVRVFVRGRKSLDSRYGIEVK